MRVLLSSYYQKIEKYDQMLTEALKAHDLDSNLLDAKIILAEALIETGKQEELSHTKIKEGIDYLHSSLQLCTEPELCEEIKMKLRKAGKILYLKQHSLD